MPDRLCSRWASIHDTNPVACFRILRNMCPFWAGDLLVHTFPSLLLAPGWTAHLLSITQIRHILGALRALGLRDVTLSCPLDGALGTFDPPDLGVEADSIMGLCAVRTTHRHNAEHIMDIVCAGRALHLFVAVRAIIYLIWILAGRRPLACGAIQYAGRWASHPLCVARLVLFAQLAARRALNIGDARVTSASGSLWTEHSGNTLGAFSL